MGNVNNGSTENERSGDDELRLIELSAGADLGDVSEVYRRIDSFGTTAERLRYLVERFSASRPPLCDAVAFCMAGKLWSLDQDVLYDLGIRFVELCAPRQSFETLTHIVAMVLSGFERASDRDALRKLAIMCADLGDTKGEPSCDLLFDVLFRLLECDSNLTMFDADDRRLLLDCITRCGRLLQYELEGESGRIRLLADVLNRSEGGTT